MPIFSVIFSLFLMIDFSTVTDAGINSRIPGVQMAALTFSVDSMLRLPVVVHVMHTGTPIGSPDNPSDSLISEMISLMNEAFQKDGPYYGGANMQLAFQLANRSPDCEASTGVNRVDASGVQDYVSGGITSDTNFFTNSAHEVFVKALSRWPNTDYINIWIVNTIDDNDFWPGGYAYFPEYNSALIDGIVVRASVVNGTNKTIVHELGHYFSLYHVYEDENWKDECSANNNCNVDGDRICDTEPCVFVWDCEEPLNVCSGEDWEVADSALNYTVLNNYMGFTDCQWMFTDDQKSRVYDALYTFRPGLLTSQGLAGPADMNPVSACTPVAQQAFSVYYGIQRVEFGTLEVYSHTSLGDAAFYIDRTCNQQVTVTAGDSIPVRVTGSYENPLQMKVYLDWDSDGVFHEQNERILFSEFTGVLADTIGIPLSGIELCVPLRLRVVMDVPDAQEPTSCLLSGTEEAGVGQIEDYAVIIQPRNVYSLSSGDWDDPAVWSCSCVPGESDFVTVMPGHQMVITPEMGPLECAGMTIRTGALVALDGDLRVNRWCD